MKSIFYKNCVIEEFKHPKLVGKYSIFTDECELFFRANTIKEAKEYITSIKKSITIIIAAILLTSCAATTTLPKENQEKHKPVEYFF